MTTLKTFEFGTKELKIERTFTVSGKCINAENYEAKGIPGISFEIEGIPYKLRVLKGSITGGSKASHFLGSTLNFTGIEREYEGKKYFSPKDCTVTIESALAKLAKAGVAFAGSLD